MELCSSRAVASEKPQPRPLHPCLPRPTPEAASARLTATLSQGLPGASRECTGGGGGGRGRGSLRLTREITGAAPSSGLPSVPGPLPGLFTSERGVSAHGPLSRHRAGGGSRSAAMVQEPRKSQAAGRAKRKEKQAHWALCHGRAAQRGRASERVCEGRGIRAAHGPAAGAGSSLAFGSGAADRPPLLRQPPEPQSRARRRQTEGPGSCRSPARCPHPGTSIINYQANYIDNLILYLLLPSFQIWSSIFTRA